MFKKVSIFVLLMFLLVGCGDVNVESVSKNEATAKEKVEEGSKKSESEDIPKVSTVGNVTYTLNSVGLLNKELETALELKPAQEGFNYYVVAIDYEVGKKSTSMKEDSSLLKLNSTDDHSIKSTFFADIDFEVLSNYYGHPMHYIFAELSPGTTSTHYEIFEVSEKLASEGYEWYISFVTSIGEKEKGKMYVGDIHPYQPK